MCYAIPGKIKEIRGKTILVDYFGEEKKALNELSSLSVGDYVYAQGGYVINKVSAREAEEVLSVWKETFFEYQERDLRLSRVSLERKGIDRKIAFILDKAVQGVSLDRGEIVYLLNCDQPETLELCFKTANFVRQKYLKNACCVHGILEISNYCKQDCAYCGISTHHESLSRYRMSPEEIVNTACEAIDEYRFKALVLQSGEDGAYSVDELAGMIREIKEKSPSFILVSFGEVGISGLKKLFDAGARGLLMRFETSNPELYEKFHPGRTLATRLEHIRKAYEMGYLIITGALIGLPGATVEDHAGDILLTRDLHAEMYSFGPFLPHPNTPLANTKPVSETDVLKMLAAARFAEPREARVLVTTAFETLSPDARKKGLLAGASSVMLNVTPVQYREKYAIYPNRVNQHASIQSQIDETIELLASLGRAPTDLGARMGYEDRDR